MNLKKIITYVLFMGNISLVQASHICAHHYGDCPNASRVIYVTHEIRGESMVNNKDLHHTLPLTHEKCCCDKSRCALHRKEQMVHDSYQSTKEKAKELYDTTKSKTSNAIEKTKDTARQVGHFAKDATLDVGHTVKETAYKIGHDVKEGVVEAKHDITRAKNNSTRTR